MKTSKKLLLRTLVVGLIAALSFTLLSFDYPQPDGWIKAGDKPMSYEMGIDKAAGPNGKNAGTIKSIDKTIDGFGTLMQQCSPIKYLGKRVRMTGYMKTKDVTDWAGLWMRVDTKEGKKNMPFDNMKNGKKDRSVSGTSDWKQYDIVLDVPNSSENLAFGALLSGTGQVWFTNLKFEVVDKSTPTTGMGKEDGKSELAEPSNLSFDK